MADDSAVSEPVIQVRDLHKSFGDLHVLRGISFDVAKGETLVVLGRSGTGKSVLLKILIGLLAPDAGMADVLGDRMSELAERERLEKSRRIGYVFQNAALFDSLSVLENVGFPLYQRRVPDLEIRQRVLARLEMVGLSDSIYKRPDELSGGMRKRVSLARAIIDLPELVLYDEPTTGLDPLTTDVINRIILRLRSSMGVTSVVVTHDIKSAFTIADRIIMLDGGRIVASGSPDEIAASEQTWVQHFVRGEALEWEVVDTHAFTGRSSSRHRRDASLSGRRMAVRGTGEPQSVSGRRPAIREEEKQVSGLRPAIRTRRRSTDGEQS